MINRVLLALAGILLLLGGVGCAGGTTVTIPAWQHEVERYVTDQGGGDPAVLRDVTIPGDRRGFAFIGRPEPAQSSDVYAVLLAHRPIAGNLWFIYLAGQVEQQQVKIIQLVALNVEGGRFNWRLGAADEASLARYRAYGERVWRQRFPGRASAPPGYLGFPRADDLFELTITEAHVVASERNSGATWELRLSGKAQVAGRDENSDSTAVSELKKPDVQSTMPAPEHVASRQ